MSNIDEYTDFQRKIGNRHYKINTFALKTASDEMVLAINIETWKLKGDGKMHHIQLVLDDDGIDQLLNAGKEADNDE